MARDRRLSPACRKLVAFHHGVPAVVASPGPTIQPRGPGEACTERPQISTSRALKPAREKPIAAERGSRRDSSPEGPLRMRTGGGDARTLGRRGDTDVHWWPPGSLRTMSTENDEPTGAEDAVAARLRVLTEHLEALAGDRGLLAALSPEERTRLLNAAGDLFE